MSSFHHGGVSGFILHVTRLIHRQLKSCLSRGTVNTARRFGDITVRPFIHRKLVLRVMLGEDLAVLRAEALALLALAFRLSWFPLTAASRRDFR